MIKSLNGLKVQVAFVHFVHANFICLTMAKQISNEIRLQIVTLRLAKLSFPAIAKQLGLRSPDTARSIYNRYCRSGSYLPKKRSGRPKKLSKREERFILRKVRKNPFMSCKQLMCEYNSFSPQSSVSEITIRRLLTRNNLHGRAAAKKILLRQKSRMDRRSWCASKTALSVDDWKKYCFSDECRFKLRSDGRVWVWRNPGNRYKKAYTKNLSNDRRSVHFWGCITPFGTLPLIKAPEKCNSRDYLGVVEKAGVHNLRNFGLKFIDDNCPIHRAGIVNDWKIDNGIEILPWPAHSPDLNPIENVWAYVKRQLGAMQLQFEDLEQTVTEIWDKIPQEFIDNLYKSMPKRVEACLKNKGYPTQY